MTQHIFQIARPVTLWSLHFIAVYALISAACAPRGLIEMELMRPAAALFTLVVSVVMLLWLVQAMRLSRQSTDLDTRPLSRAVVWSVIISFIAILVNLWPIAALASCTGG